MRACLASLPARYKQKSALMDFGRQWWISLYLLCEAVMQSASPVASTREATLTGSNPLSKFRDVA